MIRFEPCEDWHLHLIAPQADQVEEQAFHASAASELVANSLAVSAWIDDRCVGAGGLRPIWEDRMAAWMLLGRDAGPAMASIVKKLRFVLSTCPARRIELTVRSEFSSGCRLAALLGFGEEARLSSYFPDGSAARLFARIRQTEG